MVTLLVNIFTESICSILFPRNIIDIRVWQDNMLLSQDNTTVRHNIMCFWHSIMVCRKVSTCFWNDSSTVWQDSICYWHNNTITWQDGNKCDRIRQLRRSIMMHENVTWALILWNCLVFSPLNIRFAEREHSHIKNLFFVCKPPDLYKYWLVLEM